MQNQEMEEDSFESVKEAGNQALKEKNYAAALSWYQKATSLAKNSNQTSIAYSNMSQVYLNLQKHEDVIKAATKALDSDPSHVKSLLRRATAYEATFKYNEAFQDLNRVLQIEPKNVKATEDYKRIKTFLSSTSFQLENTVKSLLDEEIPLEQRKQAAKEIKAKAFASSEASLFFKTNCAKDIWSNISSLSVGEDCFEILIGLASHAALVDVFLLTVPLSSISDNFKSASGFQAVHYSNLLCQCGLNNPTSVNTVIAAYLQKLTGILDSTNSSMLYSSHTLMKACLDSTSRILNGKNSALAFDLFLNGQKWWNVVWVLLNFDNVSVGTSASLLFTRVLILVKEKGEEEMKKVVSRVLTPNLSSGVEGLSDQIRMAIALKQIFLVDTTIGVWCLQQEGAMGRVINLARSNDTLGQTLSVECLAAASALKDGRLLMNDDVKFVLQTLLDSNSESIKSAANLTLSKLSAAEEGIGKNEVNLDLLDISIDLVMNGKGSDQERGIESLASLVSNTSVKNLICPNMMLLKTLCEIPKTCDAKLYFGIASILAQLVINNRELQEKKIQSMDMNTETFTKFQELTKSGQMKIDSDTEEDYKTRIQYLVKSNAVPGLIILGKGDSDILLEAVSSCFNSISTVPECRGTIVAQGGVNCLISLEKHGNTATKGNARSAIARLLITTNPNLLSSSVRMDCIVPLKNQLSADHELLQFEALISLCNLATTGDAEREKICADKGLGILENVLCSDNMRVRQAATEVFCNISSCDEVYDFFIDAPQRAKLWSALCSYKEEETGISSAASATLARILSEPKVAASFIETDIVSNLLELLNSKNFDLQIRAAACLGSIGSHEIFKAKLIEANAKSVCITILKETMDEQLKQFIESALEVM